MGKVVLLFPGQGSQKPGMGKELADAFPAAKETFQRVDDALNTPLSSLCFDGPADELRLTHNAQPALFAHGAAAWAVVRDIISPLVVAAAGHSLGEHTAYHSAQSTTVESGAKLVRRRGEVMYEVGTTRPGTMAAVLGKFDRSIDEICAQATEEAGLVVAANYNSAEQVVISGEIAGVERAMELAKEAGAKRAIALPVSGAFHSPLMEPAIDGLRTAIAEAKIADPVFPVYSNVTEHAASSAEAAADLLLRQLTSPVRWMGLMQNIAADHPDALYVELGPGNVLSGLASRIVPGARTVACGTPADVDKLIQLIA